MKNNPNVNDRRKYQRVLVDTQREDLKVFVLDHGSCEVFDMSYEGAALSQPDDRVSDVEKDLIIHLKTSVDEATIPAVSVRISETVLAVNFRKIDVAARLIIDRVVSDRIVGLNMQLIDSRHYSQQADFTHWFHGPKDTNLYLWTQGGQLVRAQMEMADASMMFDDEAFYFENRNAMDGVDKLNNQQIALKVHAVLSQMSSELPSLRDFRKMVEDHVKG